LDFNPKDVEEMQYTKSDSFYPKTNSLDNLDLKTDLDGQTNTK